MGTVWLYHDVQETGKTEYLEQARKVASYIKNHPNLPDDKIPYWDFDAPDIPAAPRMHPPLLLWHRDLLN